MREVAMLAVEMKNHLTEKLLPFWKGMKDEENGGFYGAMNYDLEIQRNAEKGCILNSRILWFFSNAYKIVGESELLDYAQHAYEFLKDYFWDKRYQGVFWSLNHDGSVSDNSKHTYNQAFAIYGLSSYYDVTKDVEALSLALELFDLIEEKCCDDIGYLEAFDREFHLEENEKLSENGVLADRTMNTLLHVFEAYTELYRVSSEEKVAEKMKWILDIFAHDVYNPMLKRQEVFFDNQMNSLIDLHSYGHDIETSWLIDWGCQVLGDECYTKKMAVYTNALSEHVYDAAFDGSSLNNECCDGVVDRTKVWWVQAESVVGFLNEYHKNPDEKKYLNAVESLWSYIKNYVIDPREGSEWFANLDANGNLDSDNGMVSMWKCPYHNGRMCFEVIRRLGNDK